MDSSMTPIQRVIHAARDQSPVTGLTHNFYRYPARFSPQFVRAAIEAFSAPADWVFDPFMGGGTTLVEALALGRHALGTDISALAAFISQVKTTLYSEDELQSLEHWGERVGARIDMPATNTLAARLWNSPGLPDTSDRCQYGTGGVAWHDVRTRRSSSVRRFV